MYAKVKDCFSVSPAGQPLRSWAEKKKLLHWNSVDQTAFAPKSFALRKRHSHHQVNVTLWSCKSIYHSFGVLVEIKPFWKPTNSLCWFFGFTTTNNSKSHRIKVKEGESRLLLNNEFSLHSLWRLTPEPVRRWYKGNIFLCFSAHFLPLVPLNVIGQFASSLSFLLCDGEKNQLGLKGTEEPTRFGGSSGVFNPEDVNLWLIVHRC